MNDYHKVFIPAYDQNNNCKIALRSYESAGELHFIIVDPYSFETSCLAAKHLSNRKPDHHGSQLSRCIHIDDLRQTPYYQALHDYNAEPMNIENQGLQCATHPVRGCFLTIDLCPSNNTIEWQLFEKLIELSKINNTPTPLTLCVSGLWMITHGQEFDWLYQQHCQHNLDITWVNHSFSHPYYLGLDYAHNFLNICEDNFEQEILDTEKLFLKQGIVPSVFFRFPGLISNHVTIAKLKQYGLIPLGSSAWLSKDEPIVDGSIILIHANGNEVQGVVDNFIKKLDTINFLAIAKAIGK